jgi:hypothetical protein
VGVCGRFREEIGIEPSILDPRSSIRNIQQIPHLPRDPRRTGHASSLRRRGRRRERRRVATGLLDEQHAADRIPDRELQFDERVEAAARDVRERKRGRAEIAHRHPALHHARANLEIARIGRAIVMAERDVRTAQVQGVCAAHAASSPGGVAPRAAATTRVVQLAGDRIEDDAELRAPVDDVGDRDVPVRHAAQEVVRPVDGVDDPAAIDRAFEPGRGLLAEEAIAGKRRGQLGANQRLDLAVGAAHEILRPLELDDEPVAVAEMPERERARAARDVLRDLVAVSAHDTTPAFGFGDYSDTTRRSSSDWRIASAMRVASVASRSVSGGSRSSMTACTNSMSSRRKASAKRS